MCKPANRPGHRAFDQTAVVVAAGDNATAAVGSGAVRERQAFTTMGTSGVLAQKPLLISASLTHLFSISAHTGYLRLVSKCRAHTVALCRAPGM